MKILQNKYLQFGSEAFIIGTTGYFAHLFFSNLPWWSIAVVGGIVAFVLNTRVKSFLTGFSGGALLWGFLAYQLSSLNMDMLANRVSEMFMVNDLIAKTGALNATRLVYITAIIGGILGGFGAMTGNYGRKMWYKEEKTVEDYETKET